MPRGCLLTGSGSIRNGLGGISCTQTKRAIA
nr:MAG TPA: hypothetical protein [Caudoviricetes sp.]